MHSDRVGRRVRGAFSCGDGGVGQAVLERMDLLASTGRRWITDQAGQPSPRCARGKHSLRRLRQESTGKPAPTADWSNTNDRWVIAECRVQFRLTGQHVTVEVEC